MAADHVTPSRKRRTTSRAVRVADVAAGSLIRVAGVGTIAAVSLVCVFLAWVVAPLFASGEATLEEQIAVTATSNAVTVAVDEYGSMGWAYLDDGRFHAFAIDGGDLLASERVENGGAPSAHAIDPHSGHAAFGFADGSVVLGRISFESTFTKVDQADEKLRALAIGERTVHEDAVIERVSSDRLRAMRFHARLEQPFSLGEATEEEPQPIALLDQSRGPSGSTVAGLTTGCTLWVRRVFETKNLLTGEVTMQLTGGNHRVKRCETDGLPAWLLLSGPGDNTYLVWKNGRLVRIDNSNISAPRFAEEVSVVEPTARVTSTTFLIGKKSLVVGDSTGELGIWFRTKPEGAATVDGATMVRARRITGADSALTALAPSSRTRMLLAAHADGTIRFIHGTAGTVVAAADLPYDGRELTAAAMAPRDDAAYVLSSFLSRWELDPGHPEASLTALFRPVWYEGYVAPAHVWQSSSGTDDFEPKLGLIPLIFGTLKATLYSMLFGAPLALLAALYTSEFLDPRARGKVKPTVELMASLPSVVLGFLAAIVIAPAIDGYVPEALTSLVTIPFVILLIGHGFEVLPERARAFAKHWRLAIAMLAIPLAVTLAFVLTPAVVRVYFAGDFKLWLDGQVGTGVGAWMFLLLPLSALLATVASGRIAAAITASQRPGAALAPGWISLLRFALSSITAIVLATVLANLFTVAGFDPRGTFVDTYVQRNAMVVGFVMGFAIVPIIYTIAEDALSSVPEHLRAGSLALGATPWQTAIRIVVPTAMSGLFSALMIGLGRAVGETMIVLMAAGNTPILDWNIFSGFRTLSANIAVELPEAVRNSTHYRVLFLAALVLFSMTFVINTVAEIVRLRFRKRAFEL